MLLTYGADVVAVGAWSGIVNVGSLVVEVEHDSSSFGVGANA